MSCFHPSQSNIRQANLRTPSVLSISSRDSPYTRALKKRRVKLLREQRELGRRDERREAVVNEKIGEAKQKLAEMKGTLLHTRKSAGRAPAMGGRGFIPEVEGIRGRYDGDDRRRRYEATVETETETASETSEVYKRKRRDSRSPIGSPSGKRKSKRNHYDGHAATGSAAGSGAGRLRAEEQGELVTLAKYIEGEIPGVKFPDKFMDTVWKQQVERWRRGIERERREEVVQRVSLEFPSTWVERDVCFSLLDLLGKLQLITPFYCFFILPI